MRMWRGVLGSAAAMASMALAAPAVYAQGSPPARPFRALFGRDDTSRPARHELNLTTSLSAAIDNNAQASNPPQPGEAQDAGRSQLYTAGAQLAYVLRESRVTLNASGSASYPYYSLMPEQADSPAYGGDISLAFVPGETTVSGYGRYFYSPYYAPFLQPGYVPSGGSFDYASALSANELLSGGATLTHRLGRSTSASAGYYLSGTRFTDEDRTNGNQGVRVSMSTSVARSVTLGGGYAYSQSRVADAAASSRSESHGVDANLGYSHQWSRSSATSFSGSIGWATVTYIDSSSDRWVGSVGITHATGSGWSVNANYGRTLQYLNVTRQPTWDDSVNVGLNARISQRVSAGVSGSYLRGRQVTGGDEGFDSYSGVAGLQVALTTFMQASASYIYYRYNYPADYELPAGVPSKFDRQRVQFGMTFWLPLVHAGAPRAPRGPAS
jgi:hypothetical protein